MTETPLELLLEAQLFAAGRSLSVKELSETLGYEADEVSAALDHLQGPSSVAVALFISLRSAVVGPWRSSRKWPLISRVKPRQTFHLVC